MPSKKIARPNTLVIQVPEVFRSGSKEDFLAKLLESLSPHVVSCVQFIPGFFVCVTFESLESRQAVLGSGIVISEVMIPVMEADPTVRFVNLHHCPFEVPDKTVADALSAFGTVLDIQLSSFPGSNLFRWVSCRQDVSPGGDPHQVVRPSLSVSRLVPWSSPSL